MRSSISLAALAAALLACGQGSGGGAPAPQDLVVTRPMTWWALDGTITPGLLVDDPVDLLVPEGDGYRVVDAIREGERTYRFQDLPPGPVFVRVYHSGPRFTELEETGPGELDLGLDRIGRPDATPLTASTPLTLQLTGLQPFQADSLDLYVPALDMRRSPLFSIVELGTACTASADLVNGWPALAPEAARGDTVLVAQRHRETIGATQVETVVRFGASPAFDAPPGSQVSLAIALAPPPATRAVRADWRGAAFALLVAGAAPGATGGVYRATAYGLPLETQGGPQPYSPVVLARIEGAEDRDLGTVDLPLPAAGWGADVDVEVRATLGIPPASSYERTVAGVSLRAGATMPALAPVVGPPRAVAVAGQALTGTVTGVGTTPLLAWQSPTLGEAARYHVRVVKLPSSASVLSASTSRTQLRIPPGVLADGSSYQVEVTATSGSSDPSAPRGFATVYAGTLSP